MSTETEAVTTAAADLTHAMSRLVKAIDDIGDDGEAPAHSRRPSGRTRASGHSDQRRQRIGRLIPPASVHRPEPGLRLATKDPQILSQRQNGYRCRSPRLVATEHDGAGTRPMPDDSS